MTIIFLLLLSWASGVGMWLHAEIAHMWLCRLKCNGGIALQLFLSRSYHHMHASSGDAAVYNDYISALQDGSEIVVAEEEAPLDEGSKAPAEGLHGRTDRLALEKKIRQQLKVEILTFWLLVQRVLAGGALLLHCCVFTMTLSMSSRPLDSLSGRSQQPLYLEDKTALRDHD